MALDANGNWVPGTLHPAPPSNPKQGTGTPEGTVMGSIGDLYLDTATNDLYWKTTNSSTTGWVKTT